MTDIFEEVTAELRRDRMSTAWDKYGRYIIGLAVAIVVITAGNIGYSSYRAAQHEAASLRYDAMLETLEGASADERIAALVAFGAVEKNGYGVLAGFAAAHAQAEEGDDEAALAGFDALADTGRVPDSLRNYANLQAAIVLLNSGGALSEIETRLDDLLDEGEGLAPVARETMALAYMRDDQPLEARRLFQAQTEDASASSLSRERAGIMLQKLALTLSPSDVAADEETEKGDAE